MPKIYVKEDYKFIVYIIINIKCGWINLSTLFEIIGLTLNNFLIL